MSRPDEDLVRKTAQLARLELTPDECTALAGEFETILGAFESLQAVDVVHVSPMVRPGIEPGGGGLVDVLREDVLRPGLTRDEALANAPEPLDGFFGVPRVLGEPS